tara:strand:+ start:2876 stop:3466 length:591 start_codon:yes stop_codon:yes gene_type:complete
MKKSNGKLITKFKIAVFISGRGSNLKSILKNSNYQKTNYKVSLVVSNKKDALGLLIAKKNNIKTIISDFDKSKIKEKKVLKILKINKIHLICLAGYMKILSKNFIKSFDGKIINIHPSLLPKYKGLRTHERVLKNKDKFTGCTVHHVTKHLDSGKIIFQSKIRILKGDTAKIIEKKVRKIEHKIYPLAINKVLSNY